MSWTLPPITPLELTASAPIKVALVTNMLPPYRVSFYSALGKLVDLTVVVDTLSEFNRSWLVEPDEVDFGLKVLDSKSFVYTRTRDDVSYQEKRQFHFSEKVIGALKDLNPDVVISIEFGLKSIWSLVYGGFSDTPVILLSEGTPHTEGHVGAFKRTIRKLIVSQMSRYWSNGPESTRLLVDYGADAHRSDEGMTGIETNQWRQQVEALLPDRGDIRQSLKVEGKTFLFSASLTPRKGVKELLEVAGLLAKRGEEFSLILLGSGEEERHIDRFRGEYPEIPLVTPGFVQRDELPKFFAAADWAVLPTLDDNWPLATLETLVSGLPQIFSIYNGATSDLCEEGVTGFACDPLDQKDFLDAWSLALKQPEGRIPSNVVDQVSGYYSPESQAQRAFDSIRTVLKENSK